MDRTRVRGQDVLHEFLLSDLQLQHDGAQLHVQVVGSLQLPLIVFPDVQRMSGGEGQAPSVTVKPTQGSQMAER